MTPEPPPSTPSGIPERPRTEARFPFHTKIRLEVALGQSVSGFTADVSMSGAFMESDMPTDELRVGDKGVVFLEMKEGGSTYEVSFPCTVARINPRGVGLDFESEEA
ncbi:MAG: PilZ domain-containing protein [Magnetococcales bacterium]|nr:PilZ domain-containing protein [Magnetococcales bacterium]